MGDDDDDHSGPGGGDDGDDNYSGGGGDDDDDDDDHSGGGDNDKSGDDGDASQPVDELDMSDVPGSGTPPPTSDGERPGSVETLLDKLRDAIGRAHVRTVVTNAHLVC